jgi:hypothetical protein
MSWFSYSLVKVRAYDGLSSPGVPPLRRVKPGEDKPSPLPYSGNAHRSISRMHQLSGNDETLYRNMLPWFLVV